MSADILNTSRGRLAFDAALAAAAELQVDASGARVIDVGRDLTVALPVGQVLARVSWLAAALGDERAIDGMRRDLEISAWLADNEVPVALPFADLEPFMAGTTPVSLWERPPAGLPPTELSPDIFGAGLAQLHDGLVQYPAQLPGAAGLADDAWRILDTLSGRLGEHHGALAELAGAIAVLSAELDRVTRDRVDGTRDGVAQVLHGDARPNHVRLFDRGAVLWSHFDRSWRGPVEFDVATACIGRYSDGYAESIVTGYIAAGGPILDPDVLAVATRIVDASDIAWGLVAGRDDAEQWSEATKRLELWHSTGL